MKVAVLGVGRMGRRHVQVAKKLGMELVAIFDINSESLLQTQKEFSLLDSQLYSNLDQLYAETRPDCIIIATTADSHCALSCMAAERGVKYILVEKPMAVSLQECDAMIAACERHGAKLAINHQMRFMEQYTEPKRLAATEAYGGLASMTVIAGNFGFAMNSSHYFEAFRFLTGEYPAEVSAWFSPESVPNPRGAQFQDRAGCIRAVTASGKRLYVECSADQGHGIRVTYACRGGVLSVDELTGDLITSEREEQYRTLPTTRYGMPSLDLQRKIQPCDVVDASASVVSALISGIDSVSGEDGRRVIELLVAAHQSAEQNGAVVRLAQGLDRTRVFPWA